MVIAPPFPVTESSQHDSWNEGPLWSILDAERTVGVVLVRLGRSITSVATIAPSASVRFPRPRRRLLLGPFPSPGVAVLVSVLVGSN